VLRKIILPKQKDVTRKWKIVEPRDLYSLLLNGIRLDKYRRMRWDGNVAGLLEEHRCIFGIDAEI